MQPQPAATVHRAQPAGPEALGAGCAALLPSCDAARHGHGPPCAHTAPESAAALPWQAPGASRQHAATGRPASDRFPPSPQPGHRRGQRGWLRSHAFVRRSFTRPRVAAAGGGKGKAWETAAPRCGPNKAALCAAQRCVSGPGGLAQRSPERRTGRGSCAGPSVALTAIDGGKGPNGKHAFHGEFGPH